MCVVVENLQAVANLKATVMSELWSGSCNYVERRFTCTQTATSARMACIGECQQC